MIYNTLSIAGVDPSGGAGLLADLKAFSALGTYGMGVVCALTAQNTQGVTGVEPVAPAFIRLQLETLFADVRVDAAKVGLLSSPEVAATVADVLRQRRVPFLVVDPVLVAKSGHTLVSDDTLVALRRDVLPLADVITPNVQEASLLLGVPKPADSGGLLPLARALLDLGPKAVLLKGGHYREQDSVDWWVDADGAVELRQPRVNTQNLHGTGCNLAAALTALRPQRPDWRTAAYEAKAWLTTALARSADLSVGNGHGPVQAFHHWWPRPG